MKRWADKRKNIPLCIKPYFGQRDELTVQYGIIPEEKNSHYTFVDAERFKRENSCWTLWDQLTEQGNWVSRPECLLR